MRLQRRYRGVFPPDASTVTDIILSTLLQHCYNIVTLLLHFIKYIFNI